MADPYEPIQGLTGDHSSEATREVDRLVERWRELRSGFEGTPRFRRFLERLLREWAIETGRIEGLYEWPRGTTEVLLERGVDAATIAHEARLTHEAGERAAALILDARGVVEGLFAHVSGAREITESYVKELHAALTASQDTTRARTPDGRLVDMPLRRGAYKLQPNDPANPDGTLRHVYCSPEQTPAEMGRLVDLYRASAGDAPLVVRAAWLHHRFTQVHPFEDGNGRVARTLASLVLVEGGAFPLVVDADDRAEYIEALEDADRGDLSALVSFFASIVAMKMRNAIALAEATDVDEGRSGDAVHDIVEALKSEPPQTDPLARKIERRRDNWNRLVRDAESMLEARGREIQRAVEEEGGAPTRLKAIDFTPFVTTSTLIDDVESVVRPRIVGDGLGGAIGVVYLGFRTETWFYVGLVFYEQRPDPIPKFAVSPFWLVYDWEEPETKQRIHAVDGGPVESAGDLEDLTGEPLSVARARLRSWLVTVLDETLETWRARLDRE